MLKLYVKTGCPYCALVLEELKKKGIGFEEFNIAKKENVDFLIEHGGKRQVPYLIDETAGVSMYESAMIINYLEHLKAKGVCNSTQLEQRLGDYQTCTPF